jgi:hypothetical protein
MKDRETVAISKVWLPLRQLTGDSWARNPKVVPWAKCEPRDFAPLLVLNRHPVCALFVGLTLLFMVLGVIR